MKRNALVLFVVFCIAIAANAQAPKGSVPKEEPSQALEKSEAIAKQYLESFKKTGVPTGQAVTAALAKAKEQNSIEAWTEAAAIANTYANVIDVLTDHYSTLYYSSRSGRSDGNYAYISKAADYEKIRNRYLSMRNDAYIELAKLYAAKGDKAKALSFLITAVKLSGGEPNVEGESLIKQIIEFGE